MSSWQRIRDELCRSESPERLIARAAAGNLGVHEHTDGYDEVVDSISGMLKKRCGTPLLPKAGESLAISVIRPKTAALAFDKVYRLPIVKDPVPEEIAFYGGTPPEMLFYGGISAMLAMESMGSSPTSLAKLIKEGPSEGGSGSCERETWGFLCSELEQAVGASPTIFYFARGPMNQDFPVGSRQVLTAAITNVALVDEKEITWDQVLEFRKDVETRAKYRRFVRWVDHDLTTRSPKEVEDVVATRLDDYNWALRKHGLKALLGSLSCLLDPKFIGGVSAGVAAAGYAGGGPWAALAGTAITVGRTAISFGTAMVDGIDECRKTNYEVAYVHEIQKAFG